MECLKCSHKIPDKSERCLYCGALTRGEVPSDPRKEPSQHGAASEKTGDILGTSGTKEEMKFKKLEDLPESLRVKVEEMLRKGERETQGVEIKTKISSSNFPELLDRTSSRQGRMSFLSALRFLLKKD